MTGIQETEDVVGQLQRLLAGFAGENDLKVGPHMLAHGIEEALGAIQSLSDRIDVLEGTIIAMGKIAEDLGSKLAFLNVTDARASLRTTNREVNDAK